MDLNKVSGPITGIDITGKIVVLKKSSLKPAFHGDRRFLAEGGFGAKPYLMGRAVFGKFLIDGEDGRIDRSDIEGLAEVQA